MFGRPPKIPSCLRLVILFLTFFATPGFPAPKAGHFLVDRVRGSILVWKPLSSDWSELHRRDVVPIGSLIQSLGGGELSLVPSKKSRGFLVPAHLIFITKTIFRVTPDTTRTFHVSEAAITEESDVGNKGTKTDRALEDEPLPFPLAWERQDGLSFFMSAVPEFARGAYLSKTLALSSAKTSLFLRNAVRDIKVIFPEDGALIPIAKEQENVPIVWSLGQSEKTGQMLPMIEVFLWKKDEARGNPIKLTNASHFYLPLTKGGYFLQLATPQLSYQSRPVYFIVE